ncbi:Pkr1-domain-containing protein [Myriangium duriaei CBS 260.36]|uniref:Pkr1-domain-containing protein n=1 Tax=Myriangium duriaei CBS 260.36 TaxID=1168546 RepID=A0A9P4J5U4_9PEZI|nr:Pkr1-domain-containing protein [Myriangium duriaei CBS 260.36]
MATFLADLWSSIFTPGPTPTLLIATNATFACLQVTLFALLVGTYSIHFVILSLLCAGLWVSINWFARELQTAQAQAKAEEQKEQRRAEPREKSDTEKRREAEEGDDEAGTGTETEFEGGRSVRRSLRVRNQRSATPLAAKATGAEEGEARKRVVRDDAGTDSEWEKVEGEK